MNNMNSKGVPLTHWFSESLSAVLKKVLIRLDGLEITEEIRLRINHPLMIRTGTQEFFVDPSGRKSNRVGCYIVTKDDLEGTLEKMTNSSLYAAQEELRMGFITLPGGHRVGITGEAMVEHGRIRTLRNISALNIRIANEHTAEIKSFFSLLMDARKNFCHTLLVSPPRAGKTTLLRQLVKNLSEGIPELDLAGRTVGVVDERSEIAGMWQGIPSFDLGCRTDILDRCPKALGISMLIRSMSPSVIAVDELGSPDDAQAVRDAVRCGISILATAHAGSLDELQRRTYLQDLLSEKTFERIVILSRRMGPGTLETIYNGVNGTELWNGMNRLKVKINS